MKFDPDILQPGDHLFYWNGHSLIDWAIAIKTYTRLGHVEIYNRNCETMASRNGIGVNYYPLRTEGLVSVRRPRVILDWEAGKYWFNNTARWQKYDFKGLLCYTLAVSQGSPRKMYCSEFGLRFDRQCSFQPVNPDVDADRCPPAMLWASGMFDTVWSLQGFEP